MKKFFWDKIIVLIFGLFSAAFFHFICKGTWVGIVIPVFVLCLYCIVCKVIVFLPVDILIGKKKEYMYFVASELGWNNEVFMNTYNRTFKFIMGKDTKLFLETPEALTEEESMEAELPPIKTKLEVCYYRYSKILISWKEVNGIREVRYL